MNRRQIITGAAAMSALLTTPTHAADSPRSFLELTTWRLHNSDEAQLKRVSDYLETGRFPALIRTSARPIAALANLIGPDGPAILTITQYASLSSMQQALTGL
jgi:hypothetical protein